MTSAIRTERLTKHYGPIVGIEELSLDVPQGEVFGFLGANGAGKTTTIRMLLDLVRPTSGRASILGFDCHRESRAARARVGYLPGDMPVYPELTGAAYLDYLTRVGALPVSESRLQHLLQRFDVSRVDLMRKIRDYSQGMKRKLGIIQALMADAPLIILDEPTLGLDPLMIQAFCQTVYELRRNARTVFLSSHVLSEVEKMCDRVALIRRGRLVEIRTLRELRQQSTRRVIVEFSRPVDVACPARPGLTLVTREPSRWVLEVNGPLGPLVSCLAGLPVTDLMVETFTFEDYFLERYAGDAS
jgi:beta-exotoxin I transport system ATP-binding protein